jgi:U3 small nucleolar RNA-associated protein 14
LGRRAVLPEGDEDGVNSEVEAQEEALARKATARSKGVKAFEQHDLVALAFAGDNIVEVRGRSSRTQLVLTQSLLKRPLKSNDGKLRKTL